MKLISVALVALGSLLLVGCGEGGDSGEQDSQPLILMAEYFDSAAQSGEVRPAGFVPLSGGEHDCLIPAKPAMEGKCEWKVQAAGDGWIVSVIETWKCADYNAQQGTEAFCLRETGTRQWDYEITADGSVTLFIEKGDPAPETLIESAPSP